MASLSLPPGFRFHPTDVELIKYWLKRKSLGKKIDVAIAEINVYKYPPWDLPGLSCLKNKDLEWFFFCPISRKYASGSRFGRATETGYWKATGKDRSVVHNEETVGSIKTLVFHQGQAPKGERTDWVMHEYRILEKELAAGGVNQAPYVLVKVFKKSGLGPKNGAQYGAPFNEQEWDSDDNAETFQPPAPVPPSTVANDNTYVYTGTSSAFLQTSNNSPLSAITHNNPISNYDNSLKTITQSASFILSAHQNSLSLNDNYSLDTTTPFADLHLVAQNTSSGTRNDSYSMDTLTSPVTAHNNSSIITGTPTVPLLPVPRPSTTMAWANGGAPDVGEADIVSMMNIFSEDDFRDIPFNYNDVNQVNGEEFIELDDIYADLDDL